jgi:hypothetical protein
MKKNKESVVQTKRKKKKYMKMKKKRGLNVSERKKITK